MHCISLPQLCPGVSRVACGPMTYALPSDTLVWCCFRRYVLSALPDCSLGCYALSVWVACVRAACACAWPRFSPVLFSPPRADATMQAAMSRFAATVVTSPPVVEAATSLANTLLANPSVIAASSSLAADVVATPPVLEATANALTAGAADAATRPVVVDAARELVVGLVAQEAVRTAAADAAWAVVKVGVFGTGRAARARRGAAEAGVQAPPGGDAPPPPPPPPPPGLAAAPLVGKEQPGGSLVAAAGAP